MRKVLVILTLMVTMLLAAGCASFASDITPPPNADTIAQSTAPTAVQANKPTEALMPESMSTVPALPTSELPAPTQANAPMPDKVVVTGKITGETSGIKIDGITVQLTGFDGMKQAMQLETTTATDGSFRFEAVPFVAGRAFMASAEINGLLMSSEVYHSLDKTPDAVIDLPIPIIGTTTNASQLHSSRAHILLDFSKPDLVQVVQLFVLNNKDSKAIIADGTKPIFKVDVPKEATNLQFGDGSVLGEHYIQTDDGFGETSAIVPGEGSQLMFAYELPFKNKQDIRINVPVETDAAVVMVPDGLIKVKGEGLTPGGTRAIQGSTLAMYNVSNLAAGSTLEFQISKGGEGVVDVSDSTGLIIGAVALALALVGVIFWLGRQKRVRDHDDEGFSDKLPDTKEDVIDAIIALDDSFQEGRIDEEAYKTRRNALKNMLKEIQ